MSDKLTLERAMPLATVPVMTNSRLFRTARFWVITTLLLGMNLTAADWTAVVSPAGLIRFEHDGKEVASLVPGLFEVPWQSATMNEGKAGQPVKDGVHRGEIHAPGGSKVPVELRVVEDGDAIRCEYRLTPAAPIKLNSLHVSLTLPATIWAGGAFSTDGKSGALPQNFQATGLHNASMRKLGITGPRGGSLQLSFAQAAQVLVQDDRQWGQTFSVRMGSKQADGDTWPAGKTFALAFTLSADGGLKLEEDGPVAIQAGHDWLPLNVSLDIVPGSALDFSQVVPHVAPAGKAGRVIVNPAGRFAFAAAPDTPVRFYGINLCFSAHYLEDELAERLAERLFRLGYNAVRVHHYERELISRTNDGSGQLNPAKLAQLDRLFAALKQRGLYVTTDLFVSRPVPAAKIYPGESGYIGMDEYKMAVHVNERAEEDFREFARALLDHVNPYTGIRYAVDPALAWLSLVNEDCPGNFTDRIKGPLRDDWQRAWNSWLTKRYPSRAALVAALGPLPFDQDPARGTIPLQNVHAHSPATTVFNVFLAEVERDFFLRTRRFLREELGCDALLTDLNAWTNPMQMQAARKPFDYVDDHFYVDHPRFLEHPWSLPSSCPNTSPVADGASGGRNCAFTRLYGKPFTVTEFNYASPGRFRGVGGILTGALGAVQDWDGVWRFAYAHNRENVARPGKLNYFDVSADPLNQAAERASLCLFLRGDLAPAKHAVALSATTAELLLNPSSSPDKTPPWHGLAWLSRVGWTLDADDGAAGEDRLTLPIDGPAHPLRAGAEKQILNDLRKRDWLPADNRTDFALNRFQSDNGQVTIDAPENILTLDTARTAGGFAPAGKRIETAAAAIEIHDTDATVWVSSLDDQPIAGSGRLLITHLTDLQNTAARYADRSRKVLLAWGELPHLVHAGRATVTLRLQNPERARVYSLATNGERRGELTGLQTDANALTIPLSVDDHGKARMLYEVELAP